MPRLLFKPSPRLQLRRAAQLVCCLPLLSTRMPASIACFIAPELRGVSALRRRFVAHLRRSAVVAVVRVERVVYIAAEVIRTMKPRAYADEDAAGEPFRPIVAIGNAAIWSVVIVAVRAIRSHADFHSYLRLCLGWSCRKHQSGNSR